MNIIIFYCIILPNFSNNVGMSSMSMFITCCMTINSRLQLWTDELMRYSLNPVASNGSALFYIEKIYTKIKLTVRDNANQIPVKG